jgi:hypothetical protein
MAKATQRASAGDQFIYNHPDGLGFGEHFRGTNLTAEMTELDLTSGTTVTLLEYNADTDWPSVQWVDSKGLDRITTVEPQFFQDNFDPVTEEAS